MVPKIKKTPKIQPKKIPNPKNTTKNPVWFPYNTVGKANRILGKTKKNKDKSEKSRKINLLFKAIFVRPSVPDGPGGVRPSEKNPTQKSS